MSALDGWSIVVTNGLTLLGKRQGGAQLSPVYELTRQIISNGHQMGLACLAMPVKALLSLEGLDIPLDAIKIDVESLSPIERKELASAVAKAEEIIGQLRTAQSGVIVAPAAAMDAIRRRG